MASIRMAGREVGCNWACDGEPPGSPAFQALCMPNELHHADAIGAKILTTGE